MKVAGVHAHLLGVLSQLPRRLQRPPVAELIYYLDLDRTLGQPPNNAVELDINDDEIAQAVIAGLVARKLT